MFLNPGHITVFCNMLKENEWKLKGAAANPFVLWNSTSSFGSLGSQMTFDHLTSDQVREPVSIYYTNQETFIHFLH